MNRPIGIFSRFIFGLLGLFFLFLLVSCSDSDFYANYSSVRGLDGTSKFLGCTLTTSADSVPVDGYVLLKAKISGPAISLNIDGEDIDLKKPEKFVKVAKDSTFIAKVSAQDKKEVSCQIQVKISKLNRPVLCQLDASPSRVAFNSNTTVLLTSSNTFDSITIDGKKVDAKNPSLSIKLSKSRTIHAQAMTKEGQFALCSVNVGVDEEPISCNLTASSTNLTFNTSTTVTGAFSGPVKSMVIDGESVNLKTPRVTRTLKSSKVFQAQVTSENNQVASCSIEVKVDEEPVTCELIASPAEIDFNTAATLLTRFTGPVSSIQIDGQTVAISSPQITRQLTQSKTFEAVVTSENGKTARCQKEVKVNEEPIACTLTALPKNISFNGTTTLSLSYTGPVQSAQIDNQAVNLANPIVNRTLQAAKTLTATIHSTQDKTATCSVAVGVDEEPVNCSLQAVPNRIEYNGTTIVKATFDGPVASLTIDGRAISLSNPELSLQLSASRTVQAIVTSENNKTSACSVRVDVEEQPVSCQLIASPSQIAYGATTEIRSVFSGPVQSVEIDGLVVDKNQARLQRTLTQDRTIQGQVTSVGGRIAICSVRVEVAEMPVSCTLTASPAEIAYNGSTNISLRFTGPVQSAVIDGQSVGLTSLTVQRTLTASRTILAEVTSVEGRKSGCSVNIGVGEQPISCQLTASPQQLYIDETTQLSTSFIGPVASIRIDGEQVALNNPRISRRVTASKTFVAELVSVSGLTASCTVNVTATPNCSSNPVVDANATFNTPIDVSYRTGDMGRNNLSGYTKGLLANFVNPYCSLNYDPQAPNGWTNPTLGTNQATRDMVCHLYGYQRAEEEYGYWRYASPGNNVTALWDPATSALRPYQASSNLVGNRVLVWTKCKGRIYDACKQSYINTFQCRN